MTGPLIPDCGCSATSAMGCFSLSTLDFRRARKHIKMPMRIKPQTPPITLPTITPVLLFGDSATAETAAPADSVGPEVEEEKVVDVAEVLMDKEEVEVAVEAADVDVVFSILDLINEPFPKYSNQPFIRSSREKNWLLIARAYLCLQLRYQVFPYYCHRHPFHSNIQRIHTCSFPCCKFPAILASSKSIQIRHHRGCARHKDPKWYLRTASESVDQLLSDKSYYIGWVDCMYLAGNMCKNCSMLSLLSRLGPGNRPYS